MALSWSHQDGSPVSNFAGSNLDLEIWDFFRELNWAWDSDRKHGFKLAPYFSSSFLEGKWDPMDREIQDGEIL